MLTEVLSVPEGLGWAVLVVTSGLAGGAVAEIGKALIAWRDRSQDTKERGADRQHQSNLQEDQLSTQKAMQEAELQHREAMQASEREHAMRLRRETDHAVARKDFIPLAEDVQDWVIMQLTQVQSDDFHYTGGAEVTPRLSSPSEVIATLRRIARGHPTREVRELADALHDSVGGAFNWIDLAAHGYDGTYPDRPDDELLFEWNTRARDLIESLHVDSATATPEGPRP